MSTFYDEMAELTLELIEEYGQPVTLRDTTPGGYDPVTGTVSPGEIVERAGSCILQDYGLHESGAANLAGSDIRQSDKKIMIAAKGLTPPIEPGYVAEGYYHDGRPPVPTLSAQIIADGHTWTIVNIKEINPAGTPLLYEIQGRR